MGTTNPSLALPLLDCIERSEIDFAILHNVSSLESKDVISDVDTVVGADPFEVVMHLVNLKPVHGLSLVMLWEYDRGSLTSFWMTHDGGDGIQLDLLFDLKGLGRYGLRTGEALLDRVQSPRGLPVLADSTSAVYLLSKRLVKRDETRAFEAMKRLRLSCPDPEDAVSRLLSPRMRRRSIRTLRSGKIQHRGQTADTWRPRLSAWGLRRIRTRTGAVVHVQEAEKAFELLASRASLVLPDVRFESGPMSRLAQWWVTRSPTLVLIPATKASSGVPPFTTAVEVVEALEREAQRYLLAALRRSRGRGKG